ncbi:hypothetical protein FB567DRAFT_521982 [Paraphoma chrysanthemicola]|uniref:Uncharacterized protein n=1 Tax=Paraphoma chrysanthemicola TaxID=798071 RepID=A0A8K0R8C0_9PLEO|nr:hypothetical protein FB567DRAFT_521982 [Paraphoma chrysanthemicola]
MIREHLSESVVDLSAFRVRNADEAQRARAQVFNTSRPKANLDNLSSLLYTRGRLQEMGCTFTELGELITYGCPKARYDFDQMLRLGPIYDEQWSLIFVGDQAQASKDDTFLGPDLRTLKRMLKNEGVVFGFDHRRLTFGDGSEKIRHLCTVFDDLRNMWSAMRAFAQTPASKDQRDGGNSRAERGNAEVVRPGQNSHSYTETRIAGHHWTGNSCKNQSEESPPRHIGWRFSDDIDAGAVARYRDSMSQDRQRELQENFKTAISTPLPHVEDEFHVAASSAEHAEIDPSESRLLQEKLCPMSRSHLRHGPSPLQVSNCSSGAQEVIDLTHGQIVTTPGVLFGDELVANPRASNMASLGIDDDITAVMVVSCKNGEPQVPIATKTKGLKGWWRGIFGRGDENGKSSTGDRTASPWYIGG